MFVILNGDEVVRRGELGDSEVEMLKGVVKALRKFMKDIEYAYVKSGGNEYVGIFKDNIAVFVSCKEEILGVALLKAEKILLDFLHESKS